MTWIANVKGAECPNGFANAEAALDFVAENYQSDISRDTDLIRSAYSQIENIEIDGYFAGVSWHICRPQMKTNNNVTEVNPLSDLIKTPEEILRDRKYRITKALLEHIQSKLMSDHNSYYDGSDELITIPIDFSHPSQLLDAVNPQVEAVLTKKGWIVVHHDYKEIKLRPDLSRRE